ncbi:hypothetical protein VIGAN_03106100 [Vigna angularis var. angularis]|uniref:Uncharacterized protein n=1 Tax=Vigna angularis var. angularis TaxID=157739 RepID=A0A0S3RLH4_PHAAN|nr:hypothetical protein VIGAN_03106100 [Vigna angularis var. angularis]
MAIAFISFRVLSSAKALGSSSVRVKIALPVLNAIHNATSRTKLSIFTLSFSFACINKKQFLSMSIAASISLLAFPIVSNVPIVSNALPNRNKSSKIISQSSGNIEHNNNKD